MKRKQSQPVRLVLAEQSSRSWQCSWLASSTSITDEVTDSQPVVKRQKLIGRKGANDPLSLIKKSANSTVKLHWLPTVEDGDHQAALATVLVDEILPASNSPLTRAELMPMLIKNSTADTVQEELVDSSLEACLLFSCEQVFLHVRLSSRSHSNQSSREAVYLLSDQSGKLGCLNCPSKLCLTARQQNLLDCLTDLASSGKTSLSKPLIIVACLRVERLLAASSSSRHRLGDDPADWPTSRGVWCRRLAHLVQLDWGLTDRSVQPVPASSGRENLMLFFDQVMDNNLGRSGSSEALISWYHTQSELVAMDKLGMHSQLRPYQRMALAWAARRELEPQLATGIVGGLLREAYREIQLPTAKAAYATKDPTVMSSSTSATAVYYSPYHNHFVLRLPAWEKHSAEELGANSIARGGILADEMGLGKTVEMIALILAHPPPSPPANEDCTNIIDREDAEQLESKSPIGRQLYCLCNNAEVIGMNYGRRQRTDPIILLDYVVCDSCGDVQHRRCVGLAASSNLRRQSERGYLCPVCLLRQPPVPGRATLFVVPPILLEQVKLEFVRHTARPDFNLTVYSGIEHGYVQPMDLAQSDVVVTTYGVLQRESRFVLTDLIDEKHRRQRRYNRSARYPGHISPLTCVHWWRIVLDEAQTICSSNTQLAGMTNRLSAVNRWCVTGTPVQTGLSDLHGLFQFLGAPVAQCSRWFKHLLLYPYQAGSYQPLVEFTASLLWRQTKSRVADQIGIPPLTERVYRLSFSGIESLYYRLRMESERSAWRRTLDRLALPRSLRLDEINRALLKQLLGPLSCMRQACDFPALMRSVRVHHQWTATAAVAAAAAAAATGGTAAGGQMNFPPSAYVGVGEYMTMDEVLDSLIQKTRISLKEEHRRWLMAVNGLAAIAFNVDNCPATAAQLYREALDSIAYHCEFVKTDSAQELHAIHWLHEVLELDKAKQLPRAVGDDSLPERETVLRDRMVANQQSVVAQARSKANLVSENIAAEESRLALNEDWLVDLLHRHWPNSTSALADSLTDLLCYDNSRLAGQLRACSTPAGVGMALHSELDRLKSTRAKLTAAMAEIEGNWTEQQFREYVMHCLRRAEGLDSCRWCSCEQLFNEYKKAVFLPAGFVEDKRLPPLIDSLLSRLVRFVQNDPAAIADLTSQLNSLKLMRREYNLLHDLWIELGQLQSVKDEIDQALTRLRLLQPGEQTDAMTKNFVHSRLEFDEKKQRYLADKAICSATRARELGRLKYLINVKADRTAKAAAESAASAAADRGPEQEDCPVCRRSLPSRWHVLGCAHQLCLNCLRRLLKCSRLVCPVCRQTSLQSDIKTVFSRPNLSSQHHQSSSTSDSHSDSLSQFDCYGDYSTKVSGIVRCLKSIEASEPGAKVLVFSSFPAMLELLRSALIINGIPHAFVMDSRTRDSGIEKFKSEARLTVLLLSINYGANGLNLIEANHVLLAEPQLNPAQELQAIGRIDRIGQTKPTCVHRFLVSNTIEEALWSAVRTSNDSSTIANAASQSCSLTVDQLTELLCPSPDADTDDIMEA
ncbi:hypothetical protein BOX15_Mlig024082g11 [Macrostomum lignano]|uniref:RING-type domain-containing protein n=1 Tax=Macrostomum lignano TaxID=282301 RepID=A0A267DCV1_9PLAT|nr:hypothetical protein BOX15_Mlig024082g11 [Macrostomum lignano]